MSEQPILSSSEAFAAMHRFLEMYWERGQSEEIAMLLGSMTILDDGKCADPALWNDWTTAIREILADR